MPSYDSGLKNGCDDRLTHVLTPVASGLGPRSSQTKTLPDAIVLLSSVSKRLVTIGSTPTATA